MSTFPDAIVLAGGSGRRLGGVDKPALVIGGTSLLDRVLVAVDESSVVVVVGPPRLTARPVLFASERLHHVLSPLNAMHVALPPAEPLLGSPNQGVGGGGTTASVVGLRYACRRTTRRGAHMTTIESWLDETCRLLGLPDVPGPEVTDRLLELARDVAHGVARPAAPLTTYLFGLAVGATQANAAEIERLAALISTAAASHHDPGAAAE